MKTIRQIGSLAFVLGLFTAIFAGIPWYVVVCDDPVVPLWLRIAIFGLLGGIGVVLVSLALEQRKYKTSKEELANEQRQQGVLLLNATEVPGREVTEILGMAQGHTVFAIWLGKGLPA